MSIPTAICMRCGVLYYGWSLKYHPGQHCSRCGDVLVRLPAVDDGCDDKAYDVDTENHKLSSDIF